jgi:hypothetical protein
MRCTHSNLQKEWFMVKINNDVNFRWKTWKKGISLRPRTRCGNNAQLYFKQLGWDVDVNGPTQDRVKVPTLMKLVTVIRVHKWHEVEICALLGYYAALNVGSVPKFRHNQSVPSSSVKKYNFLTLWDGTDRLSRNVGTKLPLYDA